MSPVRMNVAGKPAASAIAIACSSEGAGPVSEMSPLRVPYGTPSTPSAVAGLKE